MIDIIIPIYNRYEYLDRVLKSISIQTIKDKINVIIVNDGSDYDYKDLIGKYEKYFPIKEIRLKKKHGAYYARNIGIKNSTSKYIVFVDSDDELYNECSLQILLNNIENSNYKLVAGRVKRKDKIDRRIGYPVAKIYEREFILKNKIYFKDYFASEDFYFNALYMMHIKKEEYKEIDDILYIYHQGTEDSVYVKNKDFIRLTKDIIKGFNDAYKRSKKYNSPYIKNIIYIIFKHNSSVYCNNKNSEYFKNENEINEFININYKFYNRYKDIIRKYMNSNENICEFIKVLERW